MDSSNGQVVNSAAEVYEAFFVPALFAEWAGRIADRIAPQPGQVVLDVACGTGVAARELARRIGPANVTGLDCNEGMLAVARARAPEIRWLVGDVHALPVEPASFDAVVCQFGLMFFDDRAAALRQMWRALRPGGQLAVAVWGPLEATPGYAAMVALLDRLFGAEIASELRAPFCLGGEETFAAVLESAGLSGFELSTVVGEARFPSIAEWVRIDVRGWTLADKLTDAQFARLQAEAARELRGFTDPDGAVRFPSPAHIATVRKPAWLGS